MKLAALAALAALLVIIGVALGLSAHARMSDHRGFHLVAVDDVLPSVPFERPRRTWLVVIDGLSYDDAAQLSSIEWLQHVGNCGAGKAAMPTLSMPAYAILSTGVEAERVGVRANGRFDRSAAESIWDVARQSGLRVTGVSELTWWKDLFPDGWDVFRALPRADDYFARALLDTSDVQLVHPLYVDEAAHSHGKLSPEYRAALKRVDAELGGLLTKIDWAEDAMILTADHGHVDHGGHGGVQPDVRKIMTCFAGYGTAPPIMDHAPAPAPTHRDLTTLLAVLLDLRLPKNAMPPAEIDERLRLPAEYRAARTAEIATVRAKQLAALDGVRIGARRTQWIRALLAIAVAGALVVFLRRRHLTTLPWMAAALAGHVELYIGVRGSFDGTSVNTRLDWIIGSIEIGLIAAVVAVVVHRLIFRDTRRTASDELLLAFAGLLADGVQAVTFGWPMGYPLPRAELMFAPFFLSTFVVTHAFVACALYVGLAIRDRVGRSAGAPR